jgi:XTP/dITP diphosphohydrolase
MRLLIATTNEGKLAEIASILAGLPLELVTPARFPHVPAPEETGATFDENARLKAVHYSRATGLPAVADDSGLEIDALEGRPGILSARFGGDVSYAERFRLIYDELAARRALGSPARFVCAVALARGGDVEFEALATVEGRIADAPRGTGGFGYDPILYYPPLRRTLAELAPDEKAEVSHRGQAFRAVRQYLACRTGSR